MLPQGSHFSRPYLSCLFYVVITKSLRLIMKRFIRSVVLMAGKSEHRGAGVHATAWSCAVIQRRDREGTHRAQEAELLREDRKLEGGRASLVFCYN